MSTKNFFIAESIVCLFFGIALIFMTNYLGNEYFTDPTWVNYGTKLVAAGYGTLLISSAVAYFSVVQTKSRIDIFSSILKVHLYTVYYPMFIAIFTDYITPLLIN